MVNVQDGTTIAVGHIFGVAPVFVYDEKTKKRTGDTDGAKVTLSCGDGMLIVKVSEDDISVIEAPGTPVAWLIRSGYYSLDGGSGMSTRFVRPVNPGDLDALASIVNSKAAAKH